MKVSVRFFALYRERAGTSQTEVDLPEGSTPEELLTRLRDAYPSLPHSDAVLIAVNSEYMSPSDSLHEGDEVAFIPPVSGGQHMIYITQEPLNPEDVTDLVRRNSNGAVVTFLGTTRDASHGRRVLYLEYEAYQPMAEKTLQQIAQEIRERWEIEEMAIAHRVGRLEIGEISLVVALASPHRKEAFEASQYALDRIKAIVPIWKKEVFEGGEAWIGSEEEGVSTSPP